MDTLDTCIGVRPSQGLHVSPGRLREVRTALGCANSVREGFPGHKNCRPSPCRTTRAHESAHVPSASGSQNAAEPEYCRPVDFGRRRQLMVPLPLAECALSRSLCPGGQHALQPPCMPGVLALRCEARSYPGRQRQASSARHLPPSAGGLAHRLAGTATTGGTIGRQEDTYQLPHRQKPEYRKSE